MNNCQQFTLILLSVVMLTELPSVAQPFGYLKSANFPQVKQNTRSYIGLRYQGRKLPKGIQEIAGWTVGTGTEPRQSYGVSYVRQGSQQMLWFQNLVSRDRSGNPNWEVIDAISLPKFNTGEQIAPPTCKLKGVSDPELIALVKYEDKEILTNIRRAWRANRRTRKIEEIPPKNIVCQNPAWGV
ncbi:hypothetical protein ACE1CI_00165 [Aerosakkonemataceae cyanobacterium BLCC-F50]|uniref:Uncharacterized protein n=1 Tax=Floridaenema flaviceps BLCC-F50 TaxID=3153642 RepID=A0ABV4XI08_9CYAN